MGTFKTHQKIIIVGILSFTLQNCHHKKEDIQMTIKDQNAPIACTLTEAELADRKNGLIQEVRQAVVDVEELKNGYVFRFSPEKDLHAKLTRLVELERQCCTFLNFKFIPAASDQPIGLEITGPVGTKMFVKMILN